MLTRHEAIHNSVHRVIINIITHYWRRPSAYSTPQGNEPHPPTAIRHPADCTTVILDTYVHTVQYCTSVPVSLLRVRVYRTYIRPSTTHQHVCRSLLLARLAGQLSTRKSVHPLTNSTYRPILFLGQTVHPPQAASIAPAHPQTLSRVFQQPLNTPVLLRAPSTSPPKLPSQSRPLRYLPFSCHPFCLFS